MAIVSIRVIQNEFKRGARLRAHPRAWLALGVLLLMVVGCDGRGAGTTGSERECWDTWECNPGRLCGEMVPCLNFVCRDDLEPVIIECPGDQCVRDDDCVVAQPYDCCLGCPRVLDRDALAEQPCLYETGFATDPPPPECVFECMACPLCFPQPLQARCELGHCVAAEQGCPSTEDASPPEASVTQLIASPAAYEGNRYRVTGTLLPGSGDCTADCPAPRCCEHRMTLDGALALSGAPCELRLGLWADRQCADTFTTEGLLPGAVYTVTGIFARDPGSSMPLSLQVDGLALAEPAGIEGAYDLTVTQVDSEPGAPSCDPPALQPGAFGRLYLAASGDRVQALAPLFDCWPAFLGSRDGQGRFETRVPVSCDECCCDYELSGEVIGSRLFGRYTAFDGQCRYEYIFEAVRDPLPHPDPPDSPL